MAKLYKDAFEALNEIRQDIHLRSRAAGWWDSAIREDLTLIATTHFESNRNLLATKLALVHSEVSEMLEGLRKGIPDDHLPHRSMEEVEAADVLIRLFDYAGARGLDLAGAVREKLAYNQHRADHKPEARAAKGGKSF